MRRFTACLLAVIMLIAMLGGCAKKEETYNVNEYKEETGAESQGEGAEKDDGEKKDKESSTTTTTTTTTTTNGKGDKESGDTPTSSDDKTDTPSKPSGGTTSDSKPSSGSGDKKPSSPGFADGGVEMNQNTQFEAGDKDTDDFVPDATDGETDYEEIHSNDGVDYVSNVKTNMKYTDITADTYDEAKLTLPTININTLDGADVTSKNTYKSATITIANTEAGYQKKDNQVEIRGRGNSTWSEFEKKPYKLKFAAKTDMFGMGAAKKWVLLANAMDETMVRNYLAFSLAKSLGLEFTTEYRYVNLFINGSYKGVYILCEQLQEGATRVDVNTSKTGEVDTGYLLEGINNRASVEEKTFTAPEVNGMSLGKNNAFQFIIKSPDGLTCSNEQRTFIKDYVTQVNEAIFKKDWNTICSLVDINSFVNMFILDEVTLNNDMGYSFYLYKKAGGKLFLGPMWDYDQSFGNSSHGTSTYKGWYAGSKHQWYTTLIEMPEFEAMVANRYKDKKGAIQGLVNDIDTIISKHSYDFAMNNYLWGGSFGSKERWRITPELVGLTTYKQNVEFLKTWLTNRLKWMENKLGV